MPQLKKRTDLLGLAGWVGIALLAGALGAIASVDASAFYGQLTKPAWAPSASVFGPVWSTLYVLMGISAWLAWRQRGFLERRYALWLFLLQLALNALWSWLFFAWHQGQWAMLDIVLLWVSIVLTVRAFWHINSLAGALLVPYLAWVTFAAALNYSVWQLNPQLL